MLARLTKKKSLTILGLNSGTSADGIDLALIEFRYDRKRVQVRYRDGHSVPFTMTVKSALEELITAEEKSAENVARANLLFGRLLGEAAVRYINQTGNRPDLIGSHGQTIGHFPRPDRSLGGKTAATIQIGDGNALACATGIPTVTDFRQADIVLGGEGAPLTPFVNHTLFADKRHGRLIVNIGGIANFSYHPTAGRFKDIRGGDCGPGNTLIDLACRLLFHKPYDRQGKIAAGGKSDRDVIRPIIKANKRRGKSAGREDFDYRLLSRVIFLARRKRLSGADILASLCDATALLIFEAIKGCLADPACEAIYLTGGGRKNRALVRAIRNYVSQTPVKLIEELGWDGDFLEAVSFAVLAGCFVYGIGSTLPEVTGAGEGGIAGKLALPPRARTS